MCALASSYHDLVLDSAAINFIRRTACKGRSNFTKYFFGGRAIHCQKDLKNPE
jgi:hypothetical protein